MLLDELQEHMSERYFSHFINPSLLVAIYDATGRKPAADQPADRMTYDDEEEDNSKRMDNDDYSNDRRRQAQGKNHMYAEEIDDNIDYGTIDD